MGKSLATVVCHVDAGSLASCTLHLIAPSDGHHLDTVSVGGNKTRNVGTGIGAVVSHQFFVDACIVGILSSLDIHII